MRRIVLALGITALLIPMMGAFEPAEARVRWGGGAQFSVGGIFFSLGFNDYDHYGHGPGYFYRTNHALNHRGYECGSACFISDGYAYHDPYCPLLQRHFSHFRFNAAGYWAGFDHVRYGHRSYGYGPYVRSYRYDHRYDSRYHGRRDGRSDRRYDRRDDRRRYGSDADSDSHRGSSDRRYDRRDDRRDDRRGNDRGYDRGNDRRDDRGKKGKANSTRSRGRRD